MLPHRNIWLSTFGAIKNATLIDAVSDYALKLRVSIRKLNQKYPQYTPCIVFSKISCHFVFCAAQRLPRLTSCPPNVLTRMQTIPT